MRLCGEMYRPRSDGKGPERPCIRPEQHTGAHGTSNCQYIRFRPLQPLARYVEMKGPEMFDYPLPVWAMDEYADSVSEHRPAKYAVVGKLVYEDGRVYYEVARIGPGAEVAEWRPRTARMALGESSGSDED